MGTGRVKRKGKDEIRLRKGRGKEDTGLGLIHKGGREGKKGRKGRG